MTSMLDAARRTAQAKIELLEQIQRLEHDVRNTMPILAGDAVYGGIARIDKAYTEYAAAARAQQETFAEMYQPVGSVS